MEPFSKPLTVYVEDNRPQCYIWPGPKGGDATLRPCTCREVSKRLQCYTKRDSAEQTNPNDWWSTQKIWLVSEPIICIPDQKWSYEWWSGGGGGGGEMMAARIISLPLPIFSSHLWAKSKTSLVRWSPEWRSLQESAGTPTRPMMDEQVKERERKRLRPVQGNLGQDRKLEESKKI